MTHDTLLRRNYWSWLCIDGLDLPCRLRCFAAEFLWRGASANWPTKTWSKRFQRWGWISKKTANSECLFWISVWVFFTEHLCICRVRVSFWLSVTMFFFGPWGIPIWNKSSDIWPKSCNTNGTYQALDQLNIWMRQVITFHCQSWSSGCYPKKGPGSPKATSIFNTKV